jgi:hypothetical protein
VCTTSVANASPACTAGACGFACRSGYASCSGACVDEQTDVAHCGSCTHGCSLANAVPGCTAGACAITSCTLGFSDCNHGAADGCEANTTTDAANCGSCGHACTPPANATATCAAGACDFTCNAGYARAGSTCVSICPSSTPNLLLAQSGNVGVAVDSQYLYWSNWTSGAIYRRPLGGGTTAPVVTGLSHPISLAVDATNVYWVDQVTGIVGAAPSGGGSTRTLASGYNELGGIGLIGTTLYYCNSKVIALPASLGAVYQISGLPTGGSPVQIAYGFGPTAQPYPMGVTAVGSTIYWADEGASAIQYTTSPGGSVTTLAVTTSNPTAMTTQGTYIYWTNYAQSGGAGAGSIGWYNTADSTQGTLVTGLTNPHQIASDAQCVYWTVPGPGQIYAVHR